MKKAILPLFILASCILLQCTDQGSIKGISGTGTLSLGIEGCYFFTIDRGAKFETFDLPQEFWQDGLRVLISARIANSHVSYCQTGLPIIDIIEIHRI
jgi:hypothetical protein